MFDIRLLVFIVYTASALKQDINFLNSNDLQEYERNTKSDINNIKEDNLATSDFINREKVSVELYYETLCPFSIQFYTTVFVSVVKKLGSYLNLTTNPYGNARTLEKDGKYTFECQHGPKECYGNKLHACALNFFVDMNKAVIFNACVMQRSGYDGSNDNAVIACGLRYKYDVIPILDCAKSNEGSKYLKEYGDASRKINLTYVPCIYIKGKEEADRDKFMKDICAAFTNPPPPCHEYTNNYNSPQLTL